MEFRIGQINIELGKIPLQEMVTTKENYYDVVLIKEPYMRKGVISRCVGSTVVVLNDNIDALLVNTKSDGWGV